jgi:hypothetical protein
MTWRFKINGVEILEPVGWDKLRIRMERHANHGINFVYSVNELGFTCTKVNGISGGADILRQAYENDTYLTTFPTLTVEYSCNGAPFVLFAQFSINLAGFRDNLSSSQVFCGIEQTGPIIQFSNNYELPINYFSDKDVNGNPFTRPPQALHTVHLPPLAYWTQNLLGTYDDDSYGFAFGLGGFNPYNPNGFFDAFAPLDNVLVDEPDDYAYTSNSWVTVGPAPAGTTIVRFKGTFWLRIASFGQSSPPYQSLLYKIRARVQVGNTWYNEIDIYNDPSGTIISVGNIFQLPYDFEQLFSSVPYPGTINVQLRINAKQTILLGGNYIEIMCPIGFEWLGPNDPPIGLYHRHQLEVLEQNLVDEPNGVDLPATLINESFSVITKLITAQQVDMISTILGRQDSYPIAQSANGAWSNVAILSGLMLRRFPAKTENVGYDPYTYSFKQLFDAVRCFFPIGWGFLLGQLRIEAVPFFYQDNVALTIEAGEIDGDVTIELDKEHTYNRARIGVDDWKVDGYNALEEVNTVISYASEWQSVNMEANYLGKIYTQTSRIIKQRQSDYRQDPNNAETSTDFYALWLDRTTITSPTKQVLQGLASGTKIKDITKVINWSFNPSDSMKRYIALELRNRYNWAGGEGNTEATGTAHTVGQTVSVSYPQSSIWYPSTYSEPVTPTDIDANLGINFYRKRQKMRVKGYVSADNFQAILINPYQRVCVDLSGTKYYGWIEQLDYIPNEASIELTLLLI